MSAERLILRKTNNLTIFPLVTVQVHTRMNFNYLFAEKPGDFTQNHEVNRMLPFFTDNSMSMFSNGLL